MSATAAPPGGRRAWPAVLQCLPGLLCLLGLLGTAPLPALGQDLPTLFRHARLRRIALEAADRDGLRLPFLPPVLLPTRSDSSFAAAPPPENAPVAPPDPAPFGLDSLEVFSRLERPVFTRRFAAVNWAFFQGRTISPLDTARTQDIRTRLQAHFGAPTRTLAEIDSVGGLPAEDVIQFEYWFVLNDSIPLVVMDVDGPVDRGVVVATDARWRDLLIEFRSAVLDRLFASDVRARFVDFWYRTRSREWSVTGFDGTSFFDRRIASPDLRLGRPSLAKYQSGSPKR